MKTIPLTKGFETIVDDEDFEDLAKSRWYVFKCRDWHLPYAKRLDGMLMHRVLLNAPDGIVCDHRNGNSLDNRRDNLRLSTRSQNKANSKRYSNNKSGFKGVSWSKQRRKWKAKIYVNLQPIDLGCFSDVIEAAAAYRAAATKFFGEFARFA